MKPSFYHCALALACASLFVSTPVNAQTVASTVVAFTPNNSSQCSVNYVGVTPNLQFQGAYIPSSVTYPQSGYCTVAATLNNTMPSSSYAVSCAVESGVGAGYLYGPEISAGTKSTTGFNLSVHYYVNNTGNLTSLSGTNAISLGGGYYVWGSGAGANNYAPFALTDLGTLYVDCTAVSL